MACARRSGGEEAGRAALSGDSETIVALSSGAPPAAIAVIRISGSRALAVVAQLAGRLPPPRQAAVRALRDADGELVDRALVLVFPGPSSATGEDLVEVHCHGGPAVVAAVERALLAHDGVRRATAGEFTRRGLLNGRIGLSEARGLADLLRAETERERRLAVRAADGEVARLVEGWRANVIGLAAKVEAMIEFGDDLDSVDQDAVLATVIADRAALAAELEQALAAPAVERWKQGWRVVVAGPPNAGKSTLVNALSRSESSIVSPIAGTTRDRVEVPVQRDGIGYVLVDTAGLRDGTDDPIERIGIDRAQRAIVQADVVLWLDDVPPPSEPSIWLHARADVPGRQDAASEEQLVVSAGNPRSVEGVWAAIAGHVASQSAGSTVAFHDDERARIAVALAELRHHSNDELMIAEGLRAAQYALGVIVGYGASEALLDRLFGAFCVGK